MLPEYYTDKINDLGDEIHDPAHAIISMREEFTNRPVDIQFEDFVVTIRRYREDELNEVD